MDKDRSQTNHDSAVFFSPWSNTEFCFKCSEGKTEHNTLNKIHQ